MRTPNLPSRLHRVLQAGAALAAAEAFKSLSHQAAARELADALALAAEVVLAAAAGPLPEGGPPASPQALPRLAGPVQVDAGLRPLLGELGYLLLEKGRPGEALSLFDALCALAPDHAAGHLGRHAVLLASGLAEAAVDAARAALAAEPSDGAAQAALAEGLVFAGRPEQARAVIARARTAGPAVGWMRLMRLGLDEGWLGRRP